MALPDITNYYLFAKTVRAGSINAAAQQLELPKSTISRRLTQLEKEQGVRLLHRSRQGLILTDVGEAFLTHCDTLLEAVDSAQQVTQRILEKPRGRVCISSPYALSQSLLAPLLPDFMAQYSEVQLEVMITNRPVNLIDDKVDLALRVRPHIEDSSLIARPISEAPLTLFAAPKLLQPHSIEQPQDLHKVDQLSLHYTSGRYHYQLTHMARGAQSKPVDINYQPKLITDDMVLLRNAAIAGHGVVALPNYLCRQAVEERTLMPILTDWQLPMGIMHLTYSHRRGLKPAVRALIDFLSERLPPIADQAF